MRLKKKLRNCLIYLLLISYTTLAFGQDQVLKVSDGSVLPFDGWCLSESAMAKIIADKEQEGARCQLKLDKLEGEVSARYNLEIGKLNSRILALEEELEFTTELKNKEISKLEEVALDSPNDYWYLFTAGGFAVGVGLTIGIVYLVGSL